MSDENDSEYIRWCNKYKPIKNHLVEDAEFDGTMFDTFDEEIAFVKSCDPRNIWTYCSGDGYDLIIPNFHLVNRMGYFITEVKWEDENEEVDLNFEKQFTVGMLREQLEKYEEDTPIEFADVNPLITVLEQNGIIVFSDE